MSFNELEILRRRAEAFLRNAQRLIEEGEYDLSVFNLEQFCQLYLKYKLLLKFGSYPRTHSIRDLLRRLADEEKQVESFLKNENNLLYITKLEDAYIVSRYIARVYEKEEAETLIRFVKEVFKPFVEKL